MKKEDDKKEEKSISPLRFAEVVGATFAGIFATCYILSAFPLPDVVARILGSIGMWGGIGTVLSMASVIGFRLSNREAGKTEKREKKLEMFEEIFKDLKQEDEKSQNAKIEKETTKSNQQTILADKNLVNKTTERWIKINKIINKKKKKYIPINAERKAEKQTDKYFD